VVEASVYLVELPKPRPVQMLAQRFETTTRNKFIDF
jgi:hypothetical protein